MCWESSWNAWLCVGWKCLLLCFTFYFWDTVVHKKQWCISIAYCYEAMKIMHEWFIERKMHLLLAVSWKMGQRWNSKVIRSWKHKQHTSLRVQQFGTVTWKAVYLNDIARYHIDPNSGLFRGGAKEYVLQEASPWYASSPSFSYHSESFQAEGTKRGRTLWGFSL